MFSKNDDFQNYHLIYYRSLFNFDQMVILKGTSVLEGHEYDI